MSLVQLRSRGILDGTISAGDLATGVGGKVLQVVSATKTDTATSSSTTYADITGLSVSITPSSTNNKILIMFNVYVAADLSNAGILLQLVRNSTAICIGDASSTRPRLSGSSYSGDLGPSTENHMGVVSNTFLDSPSTTSATTYKLQFASTGGTSIYINRTVSDRDGGTYDQRTASGITVMEIAG